VVVAHKRHLEIYDNDDYSAFLIIFMRSKPHSTFARNDVPLLPRTVASYTQPCLSVTNITFWLQNVSPAIPARWLPSLVCILEVLG
jgi:hypothetical protein